MNWDGFLQAADRAVDILIKAEIHALVLVGAGALICLHGNKEEGQLVIGAGLAVFRGGGR
jgi:hypothetical protein